MYSGGGISISVRALSQAELPATASHVSTRRVACCAWPPRNIEHVHLGKHEASKICSSTWSNGNRPQHMQAGGECCMIREAVWFACRSNRGPSYRYCDACFLLPKHQISTLLRGIRLFIPASEAVSLLTEDLASAVYESYTHQVQSNT